MSDAPKRKPRATKPSLRVNIRDVAGEAGVSTATVSRVIRGLDYPVSPEVRQRVEEAVQRLGYSPNDLARSLLSERTQTIGVVIPDLFNPNYPATIAGIEESATENNYSILLSTSDQNPDKLRDQLKMLASKRVDGLLLVGAGVDPDAESLRMLENLRIPVVIVGRHQGKKFATVHTNNAMAGQLIAQHLIDLGHRRIGVITGPQGATTSADRVKGLRTKLRSHGIDLDPALVLAGDYTPTTGYALGRQLLETSDRPTAIVGANDRTAIGAMAAARDLGLNVPQDISIIGYDDIDVAALQRPALSTISLPTREIGRIGMRTLIDLIGGAAVPRPNLLDVELIVRNSTGCAPG